MATTAIEATTMKAIVRDRYGSPDVLELQEVDEPELADDGVLVRVRAASVNRGGLVRRDGHAVDRAPDDGPAQAEDPALIGRDFAGTVEAVGKDVTELQTG